MRIFLHKKRWLYLVFLLTLGLELGILVLGQFPNVSRLYQAHFIDKSIKCWSSGLPRPLGMNDSVSFRRENLKHSCHYVGQGWADPAPDGLWTSGDEASLWLLLDSELRAPAFVQMLAWGFAPNRGMQRVTVLINGKDVKVINLFHERGSIISIALPVESFEQEGALQVKFKVHYPVSVGGTLRLGFGFSDLKITPSPLFPNNPSPLFPNS